MKFFKIIYYFFIACLGLVAFFLIFSVFPIPGNFKVMTVLSGSMEPAIKTGSIVVIKPKKDYKIGDIITFKPSSEGKFFITHRIYDIETIEGEPVYITKGDANNTPDSRRLSKNEILGKVLFAIPYLGYLIEGTKTPLGFVMVVIVPAVIIIYDELKNIKNELKNNKNNLTSFTVLFLLTGLFWIGFLTPKKAFAVFFDKENSKLNSCQAGILDFSVLSISDFSPKITPTQNAKKKIELKNHGNFNFEYQIKVENSRGELCDYLLVKDDLTGVFQPLKTFISATTTFFEKSSLEFEAKLTTNDLNLENKTCTFDFVFVGKQIGEGGFFDEEVISNTILSGRWKKVLINKVYYDVDKNHGKEFSNEWIELYNPFDSPIDISGWIIEDNNASDILPSSSVIPPKGFAIITGSTTTWDYWEIPENVVKIVLSDGKIGNGLHNDADMLVLKNSEGEVVDQMNWGVPDPNWPNYDSNLWNPGCKDVDEGHILGRLPTGYDTDDPSDFHDLALPQVEVLVPKGGEVWYVGKTYTLKWSAINPNGKDSDLSINIWYSRDSGKTWVKIEESTENDGEYDWTIPLYIDGYYVPSSHARIKITAFDPENFMIQGRGESNDFCPPVDEDSASKDKKNETQKSSLFSEPINENSDEKNIEKTEKETKKESEKETQTESENNSSSELSDDKLSNDE